MFASLVLAASLMGQPPTPDPVGPPRPPAMAPSLGTIDFYVVMPGPTAEDLRIQARMDAMCYNVNSGMFNKGGTTMRPFPTRMLRRDTPAGVYLIGRMQVVTPIPLSIAPYLGQSVINR